MKHIKTQQELILEMAIHSRDKKPHRKIEIDLSGEEGNVFQILGLASRLYKQLHPEEMEAWKEANDQV